MWQSIQVRYAEQSPKTSPWEKDHKYQLVTPILIKSMVFEQGHVRIPQCEISDTKEYYFGDTIETVTDISAREIGKLGLPVPRDSLQCFQKRSTLDSSI